MLRNHWHSKSPPAPIKCAPQCGPSIRSAPRLRNHYTRIWDIRFLPMRTPPIRRTSRKTRRTRSHIRLPTLPLSGDRTCLRQSSPSKREFLRFGLETFDIFSLKLPFSGDRRLYGNTENARKLRDFRALGAHPLRLIIKIRCLTAWLRPNRREHRKIDRRGPSLATPVYRGNPANSTGWKREFGPETRPGSQHLIYIRRLNIVGHPPPTANGRLPGVRPGAAPRRLIGELRQLRFRGNTASPVPANMRCWS